MGKDKKALEEFLRLAIVFDNMPVTDGKQRDKIAEELQKFRELPVVKEYSFDQFVVGDRNNFAFATAMAVAKSPAGVRPKRTTKAAISNTVASRFLARNARNDADATKKARSAYMVA